MEDEGLDTHLWVSNHSHRLEFGDKRLVLFDVGYAHSILLALPSIRSGVQRTSVHSGADYLQSGFTISVRLI